MNLKTHDTGEGLKLNQDLQIIWEEILSHIHIKELQILGSVMTQDV